MKHTILAAATIACAMVVLIIVVANLSAPPAAKARPDQPRAAVAVAIDSSQRSELEGAPSREVQTVDVREPAIQAAVETEPQTDPSLVPDQAGITPADRVSYLVNAQQNFRRVMLEEDSDKMRLNLALNFMRRSIATIIHDRADFPPLEKEYVTDEKPDPWFRFSCDGAWYEFSRGDFPQFDDVWDLSQLEEFPEEGWRVVENSANELFRQALDNLDKRTHR